MSQVRTGRQDLPPRPSQRPAGFGRRLVATLVDMIVLTVLPLPLGRFSLVMRFALHLLVSAAYYVTLEGGRRGQTLGKRLLGIRVVDVDDAGPIGRARALLRHVGRYVSGLACGIGYLWMLWDDREQTWHDKMARAVVVRADFIVTG